MKTVAVYKTDVADRAKAQKIMDKILQHNKNVDPSFDLEDCDNVLRVESLNGSIEKENIKKIVRSAGFQIEELF